MDKDETINKLADSLWMMTKLFIAAAGPGWTGKAMEDGKQALDAAFMNGWKPEEMRKAS